GAYEIQRLLGQGGMGIVLRAHDTTLHRDVALKLVHPALSASPIAREAFLEEARAMAAIRHPNVVQIHSCGTEGNLSYFVMELFDGGSLETKLMRVGSLAPEEALPILRSIAKGLAAIHAVGRIHGDVKPSNVLLGTRESQIALTDMGLSRALGRDEPSTEVRGTPAYISPERATALTVPPDLQPRQDVYSFAVMAVELLTGRLPFESGEPQKLLEMHANETPPDPSSLAPGLDKRLDAPLLRALLKNPRERTATPMQLVDELEKALRGTHRQLRVLVVDDDADWREMLAIAITHRFPEAIVEGASDGELGIAAAEREAPDIALIDLNMPGLNGVELTSALRALAPKGKLPIIVMSGEGGARDWKILRALGADRFFVKPVELEELFATVERLVS
ncbi:MAG: response regulator, partial [Sandaracinaceae bacterium]